ncbi:MAG: MMPL family transporter [Halioglobus sp.]
MSEPELQTWRWGSEQPLVEQLIFRSRPLLIGIFAFVTVLLAWQATLLKPDASFEKMIPMEHHYVKAMMRHIADLGAAGTTVQISVEARSGDIFDPEFLETVRLISDEAFYLPGVDQNRMRSLWSPSVRWTEVTEDGFEGDRVIDSQYDGSPEAMERLRANLLRSGELGRLVANNYRSTIVELSLFDQNPKTGEPLDYWALSTSLETLIRDKYQSDTVAIHITGFAKMVGDLLDGITSVILFAAITLVLTSLLLFYYSRSLRATVVMLLCSLIAVIWQLGLLQLLGYGMNAFSILVPFLVFAIAISHGVQVMNATAIQAVAGNSVKSSARLAFRDLYIPGGTALFSDAAGFMTMLLMPIEVISDLGVTASIGVAVIILTNLVLMPVLLSYSGLGERALQRVRRKETARQPRSWQLLSTLAQAEKAQVLLFFCIVLTVVALLLGQGLQIGDLDAGAPELHPDSRYNLDSAYINSNYSTSSDVLVVMIETEPEQCSSYANMSLMDEFLWVIDNVPGVESAIGTSTVSRLVLSGYNEGNLKWANLSRNQRALNSTFSQIPLQLVNRDCSLSLAVIYLADHKAATLTRVMSAVEGFAEAYDSDQIRFVPAAGNAGIEAAINQEISRSQMRMLYLVYGTVAALVFFSFGSIRAVICIVIPLAMTSILCQALMAQLGIGVKVATLPVIALGVGVGVDYGIYVYARLTRYLHKGYPLEQAWQKTLHNTGRAVAFTGMTLAIGVATWMWSPIKFQADMGKLLTFMFLFNMIGSLTVLPALAVYFLPKEKTS